MELSSWINNFPFGWILLGIVFVVYWVEAFFIIYHLIRFGIGTRPKVFSLIFFVGSIILFMLAVAMYNQVDFGSSTLNY